MSRTTIKVHDFYRSHNLRLIEIPVGSKSPHHKTNWPSSCLYADDIQSILDGNKSFDKYGWVLDDTHVVIDIDTHSQSENGFESLAKLESKLGFTLESVCGAIVDSPSGGRHYYFSKPAGSKFGKVFKEHYPGIDFINGHGKQVVAANSPHTGFAGHYQMSKAEGLWPIPDQIVEHLVELREKKSPEIRIAQSTLVTADRSGDEFNKSSKGLQLLIDAMIQAGYAVRRYKDHFEFDRPGKTTDSKCSGFVGQRSKQGNYQLTCFSLSDLVFPSNESMTIFHAYSLLCHRGDHKQAAIELYQLGYAVTDYGIDLSEFNTSPSPNSDPRQLETVKAMPRTKLSANDVIDFLDLTNGIHDRGEEVIEGVLRAGEVCFIGSVSKAGKSWFIGWLIWCVIAGQYWLGKKVKQGKVLLIDNELKRRELDWRHTQIASEMSRVVEEDIAKPGLLSVVSLRGKACDINDIAALIDVLDLTGYSLIVLDAVYKALPEGASENENGPMGKFMDTLQGISEKTGIAVACVHHATKGEQSYKSTLDILAGAGSFGRSLDTMIALRDHETQGLNVVEFKTRTNEGPEPLSVKFNWPAWDAVTVDPEIRRPKGIADKRQEAKDKEADEKILGVLTKEGKPLTRPQLRLRTGFGNERVSRAIVRLQESGVIERKEVKVAGKKEKVEKFRIHKKPECTEKCTEECTNN